MFKKICILILFIIFSLFTFSMQVDDTITVKREIDWEKGIIHLNLTKTVDPQKKISPDMKYIVEREIQEKLPDIFLNSVLDINVDSANTIHDAIIQRNGGIRMLKRLGLHGKNEGAYQSQDFKEIYLHYSFLLFSDNGIIPLFFNHVYPKSLNRELGFIPSREYSGLIIYAKGAYDSYGTNKQAYIEPALFPVLYDEETNVVLNKWMCDPEFLKKWGMVGYSESILEHRFIERTGGFPLKVMAYQIFGRHHCDIVLTQEAVRKLLCCENNRNILKQGRVMIIIDPEEKRAEFNQNQED